MICMQFGKEDPCYSIEHLAISFQPFSQIVYWRELIWCLLFKEFRGVRYKSITRYAPSRRTRSFCNELSHLEMQSRLTKGG
jgi:hypothetical protein